VNNVCLSRQISFFFFSLKWHHVLTCAASVIRWWGFAWMSEGICAKEQCRTARCQPPVKCQRTSDWTLSVPWVTGDVCHISSARWRMTASRTSRGAWRMFLAPDGAGVVSGARSDRSPRCRWATDRTCPAATVRRCAAVRAHRFAGTLARGILLCSDCSDWARIRCKSANMSSRSDQLHWTTGRSDEYAGY